MARRTNIRRYLVILVSAVLLFGVSATATANDDGSVEFAGHQYRLVETPMAWHEAAAHCDGIGGHLVTINSQAENDFVWGQFGDYYHWLGATDEECEGEWRWVTEEPFDYSNWAPGEPNNCCPPTHCGGDECTAEHYLAWASPSDGRWNDVPDGTLVFVCEWDVRTVEIDIKSGSYPNSINLGSRGVVPVAILTSDVFDALTVDPASVLFAEAAPLRWAAEDVDFDGDADLLFHFKTQELQLDETSNEAALTGSTFDGQDIEGIDTVEIVP
jgi:hypothetical protein